MIAHSGPLVIERRLRDALARVRAAATALGGEMATEALAELVLAESDLLSAIGIFAAGRERIAFDEGDHERRHDDPESSIY